MSVCSLSLWRFMRLLNKTINSVRYKSSPRCSRAPTNSCSARQSKRRESECESKSRTSNCACTRARDSPTRGFIQPPDTAKLESTPLSPEQEDPPRPPNFGMLQWCLRWQKSLNVGEKMGKKHLSLRFLYVNVKIFSNISNLNWVFAQTRKGLSVGFLISFRIIKDFQNSVKLL